VLSESHDIGMRAIDGQEKHMILGWDLRCPEVNGSDNLAKVGSDEKENKR